MKTIMRVFLVLGAALFLLAGCSRQRISELQGFRPGTPRQEVIAQISKLNGKILNQTSNAVLAEANPPEMKGPVQVPLTFEGGVLDRVYYPPRSQ